jgi:membrane-bound serine protease (ClpP class)
LIFAGIGLVAVELFLVPGTAIFALFGALGILVGLVMIFVDFGIFEIGSLEFYQQVMVREAMLRVMGALATAGALAMLLARFLPKIPLLGRLVLQTQLAAEGYVAPGAEESTALVGRFGEALTPLRPSGRVQIGSNVYDVITDGEFIEKGSRVRVARGDANRLVVERTTP